LFLLHRGLLVCFICRGYYVNLADEKNTQAYSRLLGTADRLFRFMTILAVPAVLLGLTLWLGFGIGAGDVWMHAKLFICHFGNRLSPCLLGFAQEVCANLNTQIRYLVSLV
jgi:putative membrane protein